jgi:hypothetical protein
MFLAHPPKPLAGASRAPIEEWASQRVARATQTVATASEMLRSADLRPSAVTGRTLWPSLEKSSVEEYADLSHKWAALLANASTSRRPSTREGRIRRREDVV